MKRLSTLESFILHNVWNLDYIHDSPYVEELPTPDFVYHYTSRDKAIAITNTLIEAADKGGEDKCGLAFTDYRFLNDSLEYKLGLSFAIDWIGHSDAFPKWLRKDVLALLKGKEDNAEFAPYVLSFCQKGDSTLHWQVYTDKKDGGYALGLDFWKLRDAVEKFNNMAMDEAERMVFHDAPPLIFLPCIYCPPSKDWKRNDDLRRKIENVLGQIFAGVSKYLYDEEIAKEPKFSNCAQWCAARIFQFASLVKSDMFRFEDEWRLVMRPSKIECKNENVYAGKPMITPKSLEIGRCLKRVIVSPHGDRKRLKYLAEFQRRRLNHGVRIENSSSSYNGR